MAWLLTSTPSRSIGTNQSVAMGLFPFWLLGSNSNHLGSKKRKRDFWNFLEGKRWPVFLSSFELQPLSSSSFSSFLCPFQKNIPAQNVEASGWLIFYLFHVLSFCPSIFFLSFLLRVELIYKKKKVKPKHFFFPPTLLPFFLLISHSLVLPFLFHHHLQRLLFR